MKNLKKGDIISFQGNLDNTSMDRTTIGFVDNAKDLCVIEAPTDGEGNNKGHLGGEFGNMELSDDKRYLQVKASQCHILKSTVETFAEISTLPDALLALRATRPESEWELVDSMIDAARDYDKYVAEQLLSEEKKKSEEISNQQKVAKEKEEEEKAKKAEEIAAKEKQDRIDLEKGKGEQSEGLESTESGTNQVNESTEKKNNPDLIENTTKKVENTTEKVDKSNANMTGDNISEQDKKNNESFRKREAEMTEKLTEIKEMLVDGFKKGALYLEEGVAVLVTPDGPYTMVNQDMLVNYLYNTPIDLELVTSTINSHVEGENKPTVTFKEELLNIKGIGEKTAEDIIKVFPTREDLLVGIKEDKLSFTARTDTALIAHYDLPTTTK